MATAAEVINGRVAVTSELHAAVKQSFVWGLGGMLIKAASFVMIPLYTHYLVPSDYGIWELLDLTLSLLGMLLNMGLTAAILKYYASAETDRDRRKVISTSFVFALLTGSLVYAAGTALIPLATRALFGPGVPNIYLFLSFTVSVMAYVGGVPYTLMRAKHQAERLVALDSIGTVVMLVLNIYFVLGLKLSLFGVLLSPLLVGTAKTLLLFVWTRHDFGFSIDPKRLRQLLVFGSPLVLSNLTLFVLNFSDRFFLREFRSLEVVGIYAVGYKFGYTLNFLVIQPFNMMWQARMYVIHKQEDHRRIFQHIFVLYALVLIAGGLGLALFSSAVVPLMVDQRYVGATSIIPIVTLAYIFLGLGYFLQVGMFLAARTVLIGVVSAASAVANLVLNIVLIRSFGMNGAAWATLMGFLVLAVGSYFFSERVCPLALGMGRVLKALLLAVGVFLVSQSLVFPAWGAALLWKAVLFGGFGALVWATGVLSEDEVATLVSVKEGALRISARWLKPVLGRP